MLKWLKAKKLPGFTLLELVVVIVVIGILAAVAIPTFSGVITRANDAKAQTTLNAIARDAQALYRFDNGATPLDWYNAFNEAVAETPVSSDYYLATETTLTLTLDLPHGTAQELIDAAALAASLEGTNPALAGPSASPNQLSIFADPSGDVGMAIASSGNCVFGTIINEAITTWSAKRDLGADCAGSIAFVDPVTVATLEVRDVSEYSNLTVPVAGTLGTPTASNNSISFAVNFTATASAPIDSYEVSRNGIVLDATVLAPLTSYTDNSAVNGTSYTYSVRAQNSIGYSTAVATVATTSYAIPQAPGFPIVEALTSQINIGWTSPTITIGSPISGYRLYKSTASGPYLLAATLTPDTQLTYTDTDVVNGTAYSYEVESYGTGGTSARSTTSATVTPIGAPASPAGLAAVASNQQISLTWDELISTPAAPVTGYLLQTSPNGTSSWTTIYDGTLLTYSHTALTNGTDYYYRVAAVNLIGTSTPSTTVSATPIAVAAAPTDLLATSGNEIVNLSWTAVTSTPAAPVSGYFISKSTSHDGPFILDQTVVGAASSSTSSTGLNNGTTYYYQIATYGQAGTGVYSAVFPEAGVTPSTVPSAPTIGTVTVTNPTTISLPFTVSSNGGSAITSYTITSTPSIALTYSGTTSPTSVTANFIKGVDYTFTLSATNLNGTSTTSVSSGSITPSPYSVVTGGTLTSDATYYYRTFTTSGTLTVTNATLTADILVIGGGGAGGGDSRGLGGDGGGGGAGGVRYFPAQSLSVTSYTTTVGNGGTASNTTVVNGSGSQFGALTIAAGGGGGANGGAAGTRGIGASNGGYQGNSALATSPAGQGYDGGGDGGFYAPGYPLGGGGGAAGVGGNGTSTNQGGIGGPGTNAYASWATATGTGSSGYYAGGGAGGTVSGGYIAQGGAGGGGNTLAAGLANTGSGGGGANHTTIRGGNGGSGVVIVRYLKTEVDQNAIVYPLVSGGALTSDSTYYYRTFTSSGTFSVSEATLNADVLVIAGGGGAGTSISGGGGAGGVSYLAGTTLSGSSSVTVGLGGAGANSGVSYAPNGGNSSFGSVVSLGGGGGGETGGGACGGQSGGSGGGASANCVSGGASTQSSTAGATGYGNPGGTSGGANAGGGGGAGAAGNPGTASPNKGGNGGVGLSTWSSWGAATGTGQNVAGTYYYAGGGGGSTWPGVSLSVVGGSGGYGGGGSGDPVTRNNGQPNTGGGGGGNNAGTLGGDGGSGVVIVRYLKSAVGG